eukprot:Clim_evm5s52 gene=Clim_evmTU5s52
MQQAFALFAGNIVIGFLVLVLCAAGFHNRGDSTWATDTNGLFAYAIGIIGNCILLVGSLIGIFDLMGKLYPGSGAFAANMLVNSMAVNIAAFGFAAAGLDTTGTGSGYEAAASFVIIQQFILIPSVLLLILRGEELKNEIGGGGNAASL